MKNSPPPDWDILLGEATDVEARVYVRGHADVEGATIEGPFCQYARTLPAQVPLRLLDTDPTPLAEAVIPDPCFWTPQMPFCYRLQVGDQRQTIGLRRLARRGADLVFDGRRYVVRGAARDQVDAGSLHDWHDQHLALVVSNPTDELCATASTFGVLLLADLRRTNMATLDAELRRLARWPAIAAVVLCGEACADAARHSRGLLVAQRIAADDPPEVAAGADLAVCEVVDRPRFPRDLPVLAVRPDPLCESPADVRAACDRLQRDLAPDWDLAGYLV